MSSTTIPKYGIFGILIFSLTISKSLVAVSPYRLTVKVKDVPGVPFSFSLTSELVLPSADSPLIACISSPAF